MSDPETCLGVRLPNSGPFATPAAILELAEHAEALGFEGVWVHDHISWVREKLSHFAAGSVEACQGQDPNFFESVTTLAVLAGRLRRASLGVAGLVVPLRDPRLLAKQLTTVEQLAGPGRLRVAFGIGAIPNDFEVVGVPFNRRGRIANDHLAALRAILQGPQPVAFESATLSFSGGEFYPRPGSIPFWITGVSDPALERATRFGDGWMTVYVTPDEYAEAYGRLRERVSAAGRDPDELTSAMEVWVCVGNTRDEAVQTSARSLIAKFKTLERGLDVSLVGDPAEVTEKILRYREAGVRYFELKFICHDARQMASMMERVAHHALPAVAGAAMAR